MTDIPAQERPYEKCFEKGPEFLTDTELLAVILRTGTNGMNVRELAGKILASGENNSLLSLMHLSKEQLLEIKGVGKVKAVQLLCIGELVKRISRLNAKQGLKFDSPSKIAGYYMETMRHLEQEHLVVLFLDTKCKLIKEQYLTKGTINRSLFSSREIFVEALRCNAVGIILIHNHPSGDPAPSRDDISSTTNLIKSGKMIGISILDHIIIGDKKYSSFKELSLMKG